MIESSRCSWYGSKVGLKCWGTRTVCRAGPAGWDDDSSGARNGGEGGQGGGSERDGDEDVEGGRSSSRDIDELARKLSREAAGMIQNQSSGSGGSIGPSTTWQGVLDNFDGSRLGEFYPEEFELLKEQGRLGSEGGDPVLIAYAGRFYSGMPFEDPVLTSLREFVPNRQDSMLGVRELIILSHLCGGFPPRETRYDAYCFSL